MWEELEEWWGKKWVMVQGFYKLEVMHITGSTKFIWKLHCSGECIDSGECLSGLQARGSVLHAWKDRVYVAAA